VLKCLEDEGLEGRSYGTSPKITTPVAIQSVDFGTLKIAVDDVSGTGVKVDFTLDYTFVWDDNRLAFSPCRMVIDTMLSSKGAEPSTHVENYWRPNLFIGTAEEPARRMTLMESTFGHVYDTAAGTSTATLFMRQTVTLPQDFDYVNFPFDKQLISIDLSVATTSLSGCRELLEKLRNDEKVDPAERSGRFLPTSGTWLWQACGTADGGCTDEQISQDIHFDQDIMALRNDTCPLRLHVRRNNIVFVIKQLLPIIIIAEAPLIALWLNPTIPPLVGARCSIHIFAMVLVMFKSGQDLGLGILKGIIWTDEFALIQFFMILIGLFETIFVHVLIRLDKTVMGLAVDSVFRKLLPFALYPSLVIGWILKGNEQLTLCYLVTFGGMLGFTMLGIFSSWRNFERVKKKRRKVIDDLRKLDLKGAHEEGRDPLDDEKTTLIMQAAFDTFDLDKSRKLEKREVRIILGALYPGLTRRQALQAMKAVKEDEIPFEDFAEAVESWHDIAVEPLPPRKRITLLERLGFRRKMKRNFKEVLSKQKVLAAFGGSSSKNPFVAAAQRASKQGDKHGNAPTGEDGASAGKVNPFLGKFKKPEGAAPQSTEAGSANPFAKALMAAFVPAASSPGTGEPVACPAGGVPSTAAAPASAQQESDAMAA
jgi:hypothetical protein